jgi:hypothetical protein
MDIFQCQRKAIDEDAADRAEFDMVNAGGLRSHCKWEDADMGLFRVLDRPKHLVGRLLHVSIFEGDDGLTVENFIVPSVNDNKYLVTLDGRGNIAFLQPLPTCMSKDDALLLAAYIVAIAGDAEKWQAVLSAVESI